jgi:hypothetical protein
MVPSSLDGLTDEQLDELEAQQGQPDINTGLVDRLAASPAPAQGFTDQQLDALPALASTPFARERGITLPPEAPAEPEPMTDHELNQLEEENYRRVDYIMPEEEFRQYWTRRKEENNEVGRFIEGVGQGAASMLGMIPEAGREIRDGMVGMVTDPVNQVQRNVQTGAEIARKAGINMVQLFDWVGNKVNDLGTWAKRRGLKQQALAKRLEQEGRLTGDELRDAEIIAAAASEANAMEPTPVEEEEDFDKAYERYQREKALEQEFAGVTDFQIGASKVSAPAATKEAYQITDEQPAETLSMLGSMVVDPVNLIPVGAGALSKLRVLRRTATLAGAPLQGVQRAADATADLAERMEFGISSRVQDITGLTAKQQAALGAGAAGAAVYADAAGGGGNVTAAVTAIGSVLPGLRYGGAIIRKTGAAAGGAATIIREAGVGGIGTARAEAAADLSRMTAIPERYRKYFTGYVDGTDSTLKRVAQDAGNPEALRRVARLADRAGVTTAARLADDVTSGAVAAGITGAPFAALQPDAERAGEVLGGIMALGGVAGVAGSVARRGATEADADIARMMADVYAVGGNIDGFSQLPHATLDKLAAMQGMLASKVDFVPLRADEYRKNKDTSEVGGEFSAGLFLEKDANNRARIYINLDARPGQGGAAAIAPHEIGHAILTSNVLDGQPRNDLRNLVNQQYGVEGVTARGREYVTRLVDGDIQNGTTGELPQVLTEQEFRDLESGNKSAADISKARKLEPSERERLINERYEELSQRSIERGEDALDWARDEIIAETFASEAPAIDFRAIRRDAAFPRLAESMLATGGRVLEMMGMRLDSGTGKMLDNPSVLFRDNPLFQDRIMQKRVKEYVRAYDQFLTGLEEAGSATPRGVELARSSRPEDMARSTHVKLRDEGRGVLENDFLFQKPDGTYAYKPQKIITAAEANRAAQIKTLYDAKKFVPVNSTEFGKRKVNGREVIGGPVLPPQFDLFTQFPQHVRQFARGMEASRAEGGSWNIDYNAIGTGSSGRYRITNMGAVRAIQRETVPFGWQVTKQNHLLAASLDLNAFRASAMRAINKGELGIFNNDMKQVEADLKTYLANHHNGLPGEATIGQQKRDTLNGLIGTGTAVQRAANPLYAELNPKGSIRTWRIDRLNDAQPSGRTGYFFDYDKINNNRMPQQIPREAQGMPDVAASGRGDGMPEDYTLGRLRDLQERYEKDLTDQDVIEEMDFILSDAPSGYFPDNVARQVDRAKQDIDEQYREWGGRDDLASVERAVNSVMRFIDRKNKPSAAPRAQAMPDAAPMRKRRVYRGVSPDVDYSSGDQFWSTSKEVAENYAFQTQSPGRIDASLTTDLPQNLYRATNKDELRDELGIKAEPYSFEFDAEVKAALQAQGYKGVRYNAGTDLGGDQAMELHIFGKTKPSDRKRGQAMPDASPQDAFEYAKRRHGTTRSIYEAGYVLPDGTMLDFSGKSDAGGYERKPDGNFGPQSGQRDYLRDTRNSDHREIRFSESQDFGGNEAMTEFMRKGAVRVDANSGLISIHGRQRLTSAQKGVIKDIVRSQDGAWLDLEDDAGNRTSLELKSGKWAPVEGLLTQWADGKTPRPRAQFMPDSADSPQRSLRDMPQSALKVLHADSNVLPKPTKKLTNATVALTLADIAEKHNGGIITSSNITPEQKSDLMILGADEAEAALRASGKNAGNWYSTAIQAALAVAGKIYKELSDVVAARSHAVLAKEADPVRAGQFALRLPLAITSQNMTVKLNTRASNEQFNIFLKTGKFDPSIAYGEKAKSISGNLDLANVMIEELGSVLALEDFVSRTFTVRELEAEASKVAGRKITIAGRKDDIVNGAAVFGPKIGQGFLQNLMGKFDPVTIDLWMRRTWGRWTGDVVGDGVTAQRLARLIDESRKVGRKLPDSIKRLRTTMRSMGETKTGKAKKPELTVSEDVELRLEEDTAFRKDVETFAKQANAEFQALYRLMSDVMTPALAAKVQDAITRAERLPDQADSILSDAYNAVIREQSKVKKQLDKAWGALSLDKKKEMVAQRSPEFAKLKGKDKAQFIKKSKPILKGDWLEAQHQAAGRTALLDNPQKNAIKPAWANAAKSIVSELNPIDIPSDMDRRVITEVVNGIREELERRGYNVTNADVQAILWYPEKDLWAKLRGEEESILKQSYDDEFINIAEGLGLGREAREVAKQIRGY